MKYLTLFTAALLSLACPAVADDAKAAELKVAESTFKATAPWAAKAEPRRMSSGGFTIAGKDGAAGIEADFYHFGAGGGGGAEANIKRWQGQFQPGDDGSLPEPQKEEVKLGDKTAIFVTFKGTFLSGSVMDAKRTPMPGYVMTGVIIPSDAGDIFIKISGPEAAMTAAKEDIRKLVGSAFPAAK